MIFEITEADEVATMKDRALSNLRAQVMACESHGVIDMYERAAWGAGATVAETEAILNEARRVLVELDP